MFIRMIRPLVLAGPVIVRRREVGGHLTTCSRPYIYFKMVAYEKPDCYSIWLWKSCTRLSTAATGMATEVFIRVFNPEPAGPI